MISCTYLAAKKIPGDCLTCNHWSKPERRCIHPQSPKQASKQKPESDSNVDAFVEGIEDLKKRHIEY